MNKIQTITWHYVLDIHQTSVSIDEWYCIYFFKKR